jgi:hypothetical protein
MGWGSKGAWACDPKPGYEGAQERLRATKLLEALPAPAPSIGERQRTGGCNYGTGKAWVAWPSLPPAAKCAAGEPGDQKCSAYEMSTDLTGLQFNGCAESHGGYYSVGESEWDPTFPKVVSEVVALHFCEFQSKSVEFPPFFD